MYYVYFLRSALNPRKTYVGACEDLKARLLKHREGGCLSTRLYRPWKLEAYVAVNTKLKAIELEKYFKSGSGRAFAEKRFRQT